jgi:hypothetical protein
MRRRDDVTKRKPKGKVCINCHDPVRPIEGKVMAMRGNAAAYRHVDPPQGCALGDPLMDRQVEDG